jgi:hypothetical protein
VSPLASAGWAAQTYPPVQSVALPDCGSRWRGLQSMRREAVFLCTTLCAPPRNVNRAATQTGDKTRTAAVESGARTIFRNGPRVSSRIHMRCPLLQLARPPSCAPVVVMATQRQRPIFDHCVSSALECRATARAQCAWEWCTETAVVTFAAYLTWLQTNFQVQPTTSVGTLSDARIHVDHCADKL